MYEVRFIKSDGADTLILATPFLSEAEDTITAADSIAYARVEIWYDGRCIKLLDHSAVMPRARKKASGTGCC
jgi:hypothetical protein